MQKDNSLSMLLKTIKNNQVYAERLVIETGKTNGDFIEVTKNLDANVEVILEGARSVNNGQVVKVINKK